MERCKTLKEHIIKRGSWRQSEYDSCLFFTFAEEGTKIAIIAVYVDDLLITGSWEVEIEQIQRHLLQVFEGNVDRNPQSYLGLQMDRDET